MAQSNDEAAVNTAVAALTTAMLQADAAALGRLVADQLSYGHSSGMLETKAQFIDVIASRKTIYKSISLSEPSTVVAGDNAIVRHIFHQRRHPAGLATPGWRLEAAGAASLQADVLATFSAGAALLAALVIASASDTVLSWQWLSRPPRRGDTNQERTRELGYLSRRDPRDAA